MAKFHIPSLQPEVVGHIGPVSVTNTLVNSWLAIGVFLVVGILLFRKVTLRPGRLQNTLEFFVEKLLDFCDQVTGDRAKTRRFFPFVGSLFFFILVSNWLGLMPGTGSITLGHSPLFRPANTDLNLTIAMALATIILSHLMAFSAIGVFAHLNKFVQVGSVVKSFRHGGMSVFTAAINFGVGLIEVVGEISRVLSLSLRLFGNIFAGEVLLTVISGLAGLIIPTPFIMLELFVGLIQAVVFSTLALVYLTMASESPHGAEH